MKKLFWILIVSGCFLGLLGASSWAGFVSVGTVEGNLRNGPGFDCEVKTILAQYTPLYILDKSNGWYKVKDNLRNEGWIHNSEVSSTHTVMVRKIRVALRSGPSTRYSQITTLYNGSILKVLKSTKNWLQVEIIDPPEGTIGWVNKRMVWGI